MKQWFAVYTMTGHEKKVAIYLKKKEIEYFLPLKAFTSSWTDLNKNRNPVLFPSTIFVYITLDQFENVKQISGVLNFFHWFDEPASFNDNEIEMINLFLLEHKVVEIEKTAVKPFLKPASGKKEVRVKNMFFLLNQLSLPSMGYVLISREELQQTKLVEKDDILQTNVVSKSFRPIL